MSLSGVRKWNLGFFVFVVQATAFATIVLHYDWQVSPIVIYGKYKVMVSDDLPVSAFLVPLYAPVQYSAKPQKLEIEKILSFDKSME